ncbi:polyketide cyclase [Nocardioides sp. GY 10113]|uniref:SRPBCC family protein n=1 Tax=Nocardioides sp. GY 10113 TaxID=2569761 RepID=UPI0010A926B4|nr:SRPBCC family protein [Nocardioides sp. GY 10113]TIC84893.1 polyketide cyclase [Nocardioides sp. GY 10113]
MTQVVRRRVPTRWGAEDVFAYLLDFSRAEEWDSGTVSCERVSGDGGVGTRYRNVSRFLGRETELDYVVERVDADHLTFVVVGRNSTVTSTDTVTVARSAAGSVVDYRAEFEFAGLARVVGPLLGPFLKRLGDDTAAQLRRVLDARATG